MNDNLYGNLSWFNNAIMYRFLAPELSAQLRVAATGNPLVILSLTPTLPVLVFLAIKILNPYVIHESYQRIDPAAAE